MIYLEQHGTRKFFACAIMIFLSIGPLYLLADNSYRRFFWITSLLTVFIFFRHLGLRPFLFAYIILMWIPMQANIGPLSPVDFLILIAPTIYYVMSLIVRGKSIRLLRLPVTLFLLVICSILPYVLGTRLHDIGISNLVLNIFVPVILMMLVREVSSNEETIWNIFRTLSLVLVLIALLPLVLPYGEDILPDEEIKDTWRLGIGRYYYLPFFGDIILTSTAIGTALGRSLPILLAYFLSKDKSISVLDVLLFSFTAILLFLSGTRAGWLGAGVGILIVLFFSFLKGQRKKLWKFVVIFIVVLMILNFIQFAISVAIAERVTLTEFDFTFNNRLGKWIDGINDSINNPLGVGYTYNLISSPSNPHNVYIDIAFGAGWLGLLVFLGYLFSRCFWLLKLSLSSVNRINMLSSALLSFLVSSIITGMGNDDISMKWLYLTWWIAFGCIEGVKYHKLDKPQKETK